MRYLSTTMYNKVKTGYTTFCYCYKFTLNGGTSLFITDLDKDIKIGADTYLSSIGVTPTKIDETSGFEPSNLELDLLTDNTVITVDQLRSGKFARARLQMFVVDYNDLPSSISDDEKIIWVKTGTVGNIMTAGNLAKLEFRGFEQALKQNIVQVGSRFCRATLGDAHCKKDLTAFTNTGTVTSHNEKDVTISYSLSTNYLSNGFIEIVGGVYNGAKFDVLSNTGNAIKLMDIPKISLNGLSIKSVAGCDKSIDTCQNVFTNVANFQGEPHIPTRDSAIAGKKAKTGGAKSTSTGGTK